MHPSGVMPSVIGSASTADGIVLRTRRWAAAEPWASALIIHGLGEQSGRYEHVGDHLARAGIETFAYDHRGNGGSGGRPGDIERWSVYHDDLAERLAAARADVPDRPLVLYAHSMGGLIAAGYLLSDHPRPDATVLTAPGLDSTLSAWKQRLAPLVGRIAPTLALDNGVTAPTRCRATRRSGGSPRPTRSMGERAPPGSRPRRCSNRRGSGAVPVRSADPRSCSTGGTTGSSHRRRPWSSPTPQASSGGRTRASATSSTTSPRDRRSSTRSSPGSASRC